MTYWAAGTTAGVAESLRRKAEDAKAALRSKRYADYLAILLSRIGDIRNHVLHGASSYVVSKNRQSVEAAVIVLDVLVRGPTRRAATSRVRTLSALTGPSRSARSDAAPGMPWGQANRRRVEQLLA